MSSLSFEINWNIEPKFKYKEIRSLQLILPLSTKLGQGYIFTGVCDSVHRGICLSACWDTTPSPGTRHPPGAGTPRDQAPPGPGTPQTRHPPGPGTPRTRHPPDQAPPWTRHPPLTRHPPVQSMLGDTVKARAVRILLECNLVYNCFVRL